MDIDALRGAVAAYHLDAVRAIGRRYVAPCRRLRNTIYFGVARSGGRTHAEGPDRVVDDVLRQQIDDAVRIIEAQLERLLEVARRHADQPDVAEVEQLAALDTGRAVELPAADDPVERPSGLAK